MNQDLAADIMAKPFEFVNDIAYLSYYAVLLFFLLLLLALAVTIHELGHMLYFKLILKKKVRLRFIWDGLFSFHWETGEVTDYDGLTNEQYVQLIMWGVIGGAIPILFAGFFVEIWVWLMLVPYGVGCMHDLENFVEATSKLPEWQD